MVLEKLLGKCSKISLKGKVTKANANEPSKESIVRECGDKNTVQELYYSREHDKDKERIYDLQPGGRLVVVTVERRDFRI